MRLRRVFSIGVIGNGLTFFSNFLIPPLFIAQLGTERYGAWLYLFTIPTMLAAFDLGVSAAFSTSVYQHHSEGNLLTATRMFKTGVKVLGALMLLVLALAATVLIFLYTKYGGTELHATVFILCAYVLSGFMAELLSSSFKITGRYHQYQLINLCSKTLELTSLILLIQSNDFRLMALSLLVIRLSSMCGTTWWAMKLTPELMTGSWRGYERFRHLLLPSLMYATNPLIMFLSLQVPLLVIAPAAGLTAVVIYTTVRTLARLPLQISSQISFSLYTEYTRLQSENQNEMTEHLYGRGLRLIVILFVAYCAIGLLLGQTAYKYWIKEVPPHFLLLFLILLTDAFFESLMRHRISLSSATNVHSRDTLFQLCTVTTSVAMMWIAAQFSNDIIHILIPAAAITLLMTIRLLGRAPRKNRLSF